MILRPAFFWGMLLCSAPELLASATNYIVSQQKPLPVAREFRGVWVATVGNLDWPSKAGLSTQQQKTEFLAILDRAVQLRLNAVILQVRPACDALYASSLEPWSEYLTGRMGQAPAPLYDPLAFAVEAAHQRGLELHAWFNPFRAHNTKALSPVATSHITKTHPEWVKAYGSQLWLDPGEPGVHEHSRQVILDVVQRYDIDGVHLDDYFYPYPEKDSRGQLMAFPDWPSWKRYKVSGGTLARDEWRRNNVDRFIQKLYVTIKEKKPFVKFGVSPFGIWRPGFPPQIKGFDPYDKLFADSRKWLVQGWVDYLAPQLYWSIEPREQSYPALLKWWAGQNIKQRHLWPGDAPARIGPARSSDEILNQIRLTRQEAGASGNIHWSMRALMQNRGGVADGLINQLYAQPALVPASPWLDAAAPGAPRLTINDSLSSGFKAAWEKGAGKDIQWWVLQIRKGSKWGTEILPGQQTSHVFKDKMDLIAVTAIDRCGNASAPAVLERAAP